MVILHIISRMIRLNLIIHSKLTYPERVQIGLNDKTLKLVFIDTNNGTIIHK